MARFINDATLSKVGDVYQYLIGLYECFHMAPGDIITIEQTGDVSCISNSNSRQIEVKHHLKHSTLSARSLDFWNTLRNWILEYDRVMKFNQLILFTTSDIEKTCFSEWNTKGKQEKMDMLKEIGEKANKREKNFRECFSCIFKADEIKILDILDKVNIQSSQKQIFNIEIDFANVLRIIPKENQQSYISTLLGTLFKPLLKRNFNWEISFQEFDKHLKQLAPSFVDEKVKPMPNDYSYQKLQEKESQLYYNKRFVLAIQNIEYEKEIPNAVNDYWRKSMTVIRYYKDNLVVNSSLEDYKTDLYEKLYHTKEGSKHGKETAERSQQVAESKMLYSRVMAWDAKAFGSINPNRDFFQRGMVHEIVDDGNFVWDIGDGK